MTEKLIRYKKDFDIPDYDAQIITSAKKLADIFEATTAICKKPKKVSTKTEEEEAPINRPERK